MKLSKLQLYTKVLIGLLLGVLFGIIANQFGFSDFINSYIKPIGSAFIKLISMVVIPLVFASLLVGTSSLNDIRKLGRIGIKTVVYFFFTTVIAICLGLLLANTLKPGAGLSEDTTADLVQAGREESVAPIDKDLKKPTITDILLNIN